MLEHAPEEELGLLTLSKLKVTYQVTDDVWFFPVPLSNLKVRKTQGRQAGQSWAGQAARGRLQSSHKMQSVAYR